MDKFKQSYCLKVRRILEKALISDNNTITEHIPKLSRIMLTYHPKYIWNADECGLFYHQPLSWILCRKQTSDHKMDKTRITFLTCCNSTSREKFPLMVIGRAWKSCSFKGKTGQEMGYDYHANNKAWMTRVLVFSWLFRLQRYVARTPTRKILLLIDNSSAHAGPDTLPELPNVRVKFLPPRTTGKVQPLDLGTIGWLKRNYRRRLLFPFVREH